ncbi:MAG: hypothetical protein CBC23_012100 [Rhodospirillaceae bacterium TMED63]|nr:hypothetical protein [Rhodospirillaceae bacterium]RPF95541.1 MAG: hypothetical protein CBC23_012100 [Rhodospirillaceae bacterium TMED63]
MNLRLAHEVMARRVNCLRGVKDLEQLAKEAMPDRATPIAVSDRLRLDFEIARRDVLDQITEEEREAPTFQKLEGRLRALAVDGWVAKLDYIDLRSRIYEAG